MMKTSEQFFQDEKNLLKYIMESSFKKIPGTKYSISDSFTSLELIITPECNQSCDYCYIHQYGKESYPMEIRADKKTTLNHVKEVMEYFYRDKKMIFNAIEIFAGDLFSTDYFFDLMDILYPYFEDLYNKNIFPIRNKRSEIAIPTNLSYLLKNNLENKVIEVVNKFEKIEVNVLFSWSHDGYYAIYGREKKDLSEEYYKKAFEFLKKVPSGIHPMISSKNVHQAIQNFDWWVEILKKYMGDFDGYRHVYYPGDLEVRNGDWEDEDVEEFVRYCIHKFNYLFNTYCNSDPEKFLRFVLKSPKDENDDFLSVVNEFFSSLLNINEEDGRAGCSLQSMLTVRCSDLAIVPCHRTCYYHFIGGWFLENEEKTAIIDIKPGNVSIWTDILFHRVDFGPKCISCWNNDFCLHGCVGSQFENSGELFLPISNVCKLEKEKTKISFKLLYENGIFKKAKEMQILNDQVIRRLEHLSIELGYNDLWSSN